MSTTQTRKKRQFRIRTKLFVPLTFIVAILLITYIFPKQSSFSYSFDEGRPWQYGLLTALSLIHILQVTNVGKWGFSTRYLFNRSLLEKHNLRFMEGRLIEDLPFSLSAVYFSKGVVVVPNAVYTLSLIHI